MMFQLVDYPLRLKVFDAVANAFKAHLHPGSQGFLGLRDAAVAVDEHRKRKNNGNGKGEKLRAG